MSDFKIKIERSDSLRFVIVTFEGEEGRNIVKIPTEELSKLSYMAAMMDEKRYLSMLETGNWENKE